MCLCTPGPAPSPESRTSRGVNGEENANLLTKSSLKKKPVNILQPGRIVNVLLYLAGIGSRVGKQYILLGKVSLCCLGVFSPRRLGEGLRGRPRRFLGREKRAVARPREARCHPCHPPAGSPPPQTQALRRRIRAPLPLLVGGRARGTDCREDTSCPCAAVAVWAPCPQRRRRVGPMVLCPLTSGTMAAAPSPHLGRCRAAPEPPPPHFPPNPHSLPSPEPEQVAGGEIQKCSLKLVHCWEGKSQGLLTSPE